jgi:hypothetical protein
MNENDPKTDKPETAPCSECKQPNLISHMHRRADRQFLCPRCYIRLQPPDPRIHRPGL